MLNFEIVKQTGLRQKGELEKLFRVSRPMVNSYMNGKALPRGPNRQRIQTTIRVLEKLLDKGSLPFAENSTQEYRQRQVEKIAAHVKSILF